jgi:hypothetical protein
MQRLTRFWQIALAVQPRGDIAWLISTLPGTFFEVLQRRGSARDIVLDSLENIDRLLRTLSLRALFRAFSHPIKGGLFFIN